MKKTESQNTIMGKFGRIKDDDGSFDLFFWQNCTSSERFNAAWELVAHYLRRKGIPEHEHKLQRNVTVLKRVGC